MLLVVVVAVASVSVVRSRFDGSMPLAAGTE